jgi:hypothetical protein
VYASVRADDSARAHRPVRRHQAVRADLGDRRSLDDSPAVALDRTRQPAHQLGRVDARTVGRQRRPSTAGDAHPRHRLAGAEPAQTELVTAAAPRRRSVLTKCRLLERRGGHHQRATAEHVGVETLALQGDGNVIDPADHGAVHGRGRGRTTALPRHPFPGHREEVAAPAAVASAGTEAGDLAFDNEHTQRRIEPQQRVGGPEPGVAGTGDGDIDLAVAGERRPRCQVVIDGVHPQADAPVPALRGRGRGAPRERGHAPRFDITCLMRV